MLKGKTALVAGATGDIGKAVAKAFAVEGVQVVLAARDAARLDFMAEHEAWVSWNRDRDSCRVFIDDLDSRRPMMGWVPEASANTAREAIDAAMRATQQEGE